MPNWSGRGNGDTRICLQHLRGRRLVHTPSQSEELGTAMASEHPGLAARGKTAPSPQVTLRTSHLRATCGPPAGEGSLPVSLKSPASELSSHALSTQMPPRAAQEGKAPTDASGH